jgi:tRNA nucleotidyltransferase (CCA-adding enzyme)
VTPRLVGSLAKDTHLARPLDVDVFILFPKETARDVLEREGLAMGRAVVPQPVLKYAEHPYVHGVVDGFEVDVVPAYRLRSAAGRLSAVDRTPFHTAFVKRRATPRHRAEIRPSNSGFVASAAMVPRRPPAASAATWPNSWSSVTGRSTAP